MPMFMKFDGVDGEATAAGHEKWIEVQSYSFGASNSTTAGGGGGGGGGIVQMQDFHFVKGAGKASPTLFLACCNGRHFPNVTIDFLTPSPGRGDQTYLTYELKNVVVTSYQVGGDAGGAVPTDSFSLNFTKITYKQSVPGGTEQMFWDLISNTGGGGQ